MRRAVMRVSLFKEWARVTYESTENNVLAETTVHKWMKKIMNAWSDRSDRQIVRKSVQNAIKDNKRPAAKFILQQAQANRSFNGLMKNC